MSRFPELHRSEFEQFLEAFALPGTIKFRNNKWIGKTREGKPFVVHVKHGTTRRYPSRLVEAIARDLGVTLEEFWNWRNG